MSEALRFAEVAVHTMPGFSRGSGFVVKNLAPGLNVVYGPNGSGKSTTAKAMEYMLWPERAKTVAPFLTGHIVIGEEPLLVELEGPRLARYTPAPPAVCAADSRKRYLFALDRLLVDNPEEFAKDLASQMAGGFSVSAAFAAIERAENLDAGRTLSKGLKDLRDALAQARQAQERTRHDEEGIPALRIDLARAEEAVVEARRLAQVQDYRKAVEAWIAAKRRLKSIPREAGRVREGDRQESISLREVVRAAREALAAAEDEVARHTPSRSFAHLPNPVPAGLHDSLARSCQELQVADQSLSSAISQEDLAKRRIEQGLQRLAPYVVSGVAPEAADVPALERLAIEEEAARARKESFEKLREVLRVEPAADHDAAIRELDRELDVLRRATAKLEEWLRDTPTTPSPKADRAIAFLGLAAVASLLSFVLVWLGFVAVTAIGIAYWFLGRQPALEVSSMRPRIQEDYLRLSVASPSEWASDSVRRTVEGLYAEIARKSQDRERLSQWIAQKGAAEAAHREWADLDSQRLKAAEKYGVSFDTGSRSLAHLVPLLNEQHIVQRDLGDAEAKREVAEHQSASLLDAINGHLVGFGYGAATDRTAASRLCEALRKWEAAEDAWHKASRNLEDAEQKRYGFYERLGLPFEDDQTLDRWIVQATEFDKARADAKSRLQTIRDQRSRHLYVRDYRAESAEQIEAQLDKQVRLAETATAIREKIRDRERAVEDARQGHGVSDALARVREQEQKLLAHRDRKRALLIADVVQGAVEREILRSTVPEVFQEARRLLMRITRNEYRLEIDPVGHTFAVFDAKGHAIGLEGLSKGTRVQAMLSVRLAWVLCQETGPRLPIFLDETLANCDEERANAIMDTVNELFADRQVFYFTAQADEVVRWQQRLGPEAVNVVDMASVRALGSTPLPKMRRVAQSQFDRWAPPVVFEPGNLDIEAYGRALNVIHIDPSQPLDALHVWHVVRSPERVFEFLLAQIRTWGALREACETVSPPPLEAKEIVTARALAAGVDVARVSYLADKPRSAIDPQALADYLGKKITREAVLERAQQENWVGSRLLDSFRSRKVDGFGPGKINDLASWLLEHGYVADGEAVSYEDAVRRVYETLDAKSPGEFSQSDATRIVLSVGYEPLVSTTIL